MEEDQMFLSCFLKYIMQYYVHFLLGSLSPSIFQICTGVSDANNKTSVDLWSE